MLLLAAPILSRILLLGRIPRTADRAVIAIAFEAVLNPKSRKVKVSSDSVDEGDTAKTLQAT